MATTSDYLTQLDTDRKNLIAKFNEHNGGIDADATFTALVDKFDGMDFGGGKIVAPNGIHFQNSTFSDATEFLNKLDFSNVTEFSALFFNCTNLTSISTIDTSNGTKFNSMFNNCPKLIKIPNINTSKGTDFNYMFLKCSSLEVIETIDTSNGTNLYGMFSGCKSLKQIPSLDTNKNRSFREMFYGCILITTIGNIDTSSLTECSTMCKGCTSLVTVPILDLSRVKYASYIANMFENCPSLSDDSLNNIMASCIKGTWSGNKTLKYIGLSEEQATVCQSLSNYQSFLDAGWTTGY